MFPAPLSITSTRCSRCAMAAAKEGLPTTEVLLCSARRRGWSRPPQCFDALTHSA
jgi:hypothetical protein